MKVSRIIISFVFFVSAKSLACSCVPFNFEDQVRSSEVIFIANLKSASIAVEKEGEYEWPYVEGIFDVEKTYKGSVSGEVKVKTGFGGGDCGVPFTIGRTYAIFTSKENMTIGICDGSGQLPAYQRKEFEQKLGNLVQ